MNTKTCVAARVAGAVVVVTVAASIITTKASIHKSRNLALLIGNTTMEASARKMEIATLQMEVAQRETTSLRKVLGATQ